MSKQLLFSLDKRHFEFQFFRAGGKGGQKQNKTSSAARVIHPPSGAVGECREERSQHQNLKIAFRRCTETDKFKAWVKVEAAKLMGQPSVEERVEQAMQPQHIVVEGKDEQGRWEKVSI